MSVEQWILDALVARAPISSVRVKRGVLQPPTTHSTLHVPSPVDYEQLDSGRLVVENNRSTNNN
jgi:hypothetical protein